MTTNSRARALAAGALAMTLTVSACGDADDVVAPSDTAAATTISDPGERPETTTVAPGTTDDTAPGTTSATPPGTTTPPQETTVPPVPVDDAAIALIAAGLYTVPGAQVCDVGRYMFPASGGDLFMVCIDLVAHTDLPGRLQLSAPDGTVVGAVEVRLHEGAAEEQVAGRTAFPLVVTHPDGAQRALGVGVLFEGAATLMLAVPAFLPHARPAGTWTAAFNSGSLTGIDEFEVLSPCASGPASAVPDPFRFDPAIPFTREGPLPFAHCLAFPDVIGEPQDEAELTLEAFATDRGLALDVFILDDCGDPVVLATSIRPGEVDRNLASIGVQSVDLTVGVECS